ncbi:hypothetical protein XAP6164_350001 [Xanthomonas phaseoli pv. phaseoli]|nr:hypothetical protein XAP6164_350001 [Xanthomonas phaseoli pv. phaseoli]
MSILVVLHSASAPFPGHRQGKRGVGAAPLRITLHTRWERVGAMGVMILGVTASPR